MTHYYGYYKRHYETDTRYRLMLYMSIMQYKYCNHQKTLQIETICVCEMPRAVFWEKKM